MTHRILVVGLAAAALSAAAEPQRRLPLEGAPNFRDLGGYTTADGKRVRWGQVFRSGQLSQLTAKDYADLAGLGIRAVCDFRRDEERQAAPTRWRGENPPEVIPLPIAAQRDGPGVSARVAAGADGAEIASMMRATYQRLPFVAARQYRAALQRMMSGSGPTVFHCSAGKDRAGVFSALLLRSLGVPRETVLQDYLLTNEYLATPERLAATAKDLKARPDAVRALTIADRSYLEAAFAAIEQKHGSFDAYRRETLLLSDQDLGLLRARLLEEPAK